MNPRSTTTSDLSVIIPAYYEERRIGNTLDELAWFLKHDSYFHTKNVEVLIVAANASDRTAEIVRSKLYRFSNAKLLQPGAHVGKGRDVQYGMLRAKGATVLFMDADLATPLHHIETFYKAYLAGSDVVIATRNLKSYKQSTLKNWFAIFGNRLYQVAGGIKVEDTQCGFKMFSSAAANICFSRLTLLGWGFDIEILAIARVHQLRIQSVRINDWGDKTYSTYTDGPVRIALRSLHDFLIIRANTLCGRYKVS